MQNLTPNARGSLYMAIGSLGYVVNDGFVRRITEDGPGIYQVLCLRSIGLALVFAAMGRPRGEHTRWAHFERPLLLRVAAEICGSALFFAAIVHLEFANAQAILQVVPFAVTLAAALVLKERVQVRQYLTVLVGFVGVLIVVRPATDQFSPWSLVVIGSAAFLVVRELATRNVAPRTPALSIAFTTAVALAGLTGALSTFEGWESFTAGNVVFLGLSIAALVVGYLLTIQTVRIGDLSVSAPFRYTILVGAVAIGYLLFDEVPDRWTIVGGGLIMATGVYAVRLERLNR